MRITLENGIILDDEEGITKTLNKYCQSKGLVTYRVFTTLDPVTKRKTLLLVNKTTPVYETQLSEHMAAHIDILALAAKM